MVKARSLVDSDTFRSNFTLHTLFARHFVEAPVRAVPLNWYRTVKSAWRPGDLHHQFGGLKPTQTPPGRVWGIFGAKPAVPTKGVRVSSLVVTQNHRQASQMSDPVKDGPSLSKDYRYRARCVPAVAVRAGCDTEVPVVRALGWSHKAQSA